MENQKQQTSFSFEIDNFWEKVGVIRSPIFFSGGCEWFVGVLPKGRKGEGHYLSVFLGVANPETLRLGWKRRASFFFILLNQSGKELGRSPEVCTLFCAYTKNWGRSKELPLKKLKEKGTLENNKLIVKLEIEVHVVVDEGGMTGKEPVYALGFRIQYSQVGPVARLFRKHPDIAANLTQRSQPVKTAYMNLLIDLVETLKKPPHSFTDTELSNARTELMDLTQVGFKVDFLKTKLDAISQKRKNAKAHVQEGNDEHIKVELMNMEEEMVTSQGWLARSWNEWKVRLGYGHHVRYEKLNLRTPFL